MSSYSFSFPFSFLSAQFCSWVYYLSKCVPTLARVFQTWPLYLGLFFISFGLYFSLLSGQKL